MREMNQLVNTGRFSLANNPELVKRRHNHTELYWLVKDLAETVFINYR